MKIMIPAYPGRMWYVEEYLVPGLIAQKRSAYAKRIELNSSAEEEVEA